MNYVRLGRTGLKVSEYCMGGDNFGGQMDEAESLRVMAAAFDGGVNFIDTANVYEEGRSETYVGKFIQGRRYDVILASKGNGRIGLGPNDRQVSRKYAMDAIDDSLRRLLNTDYIDLYQIHDFPLDVPIDEFVLAYSDIIQSGKARYIGVANFAAFQLVEALWLGGKVRSASFRLSANSVQLCWLETRSASCSRSAKSTASASWRSRLGLEASCWGRISTSRPNPVAGFRPISGTINLSGTPTGHKPISTSSRRSSPLRRNTEFR